MQRPSNPLSMMASAYRRPEAAEQLDPSLPSTLSLYNALTGAHTVTSAYSFSSLEALKHFIETAFAVPPESQFLLTSFGIKFRFPMLVHEETNQIYVFDRRYFNPSLTDPQSGSRVAKSLLSDIVKHDIVSMIRPMSSPIPANSTAANEIRDQIGFKTKEGISAADIDLKALRVLLSELKRSSGWASALLSDFKSTELDAKLEDSQIEVENMLRALNVLIQYLTLTFKGVENGFNGAIDDFIRIQETSFHEKWTQEYEKLQHIKFRDTVLASLVDPKQLQRGADEATVLIGEVDGLLVKLRGKIESEIVLPKQSLTKEYDYYKLQFAKQSSPEVTEQLLKEYRHNFKELETLVSKLTADARALPTFEELITTTSAKSSDLTPEAIEKIKMLLDTYQRQSSAIVPRISAVADRLYDIQVNQASGRRNLQEKFVTNTLPTLVELQIKMLESNKLLSSDIASCLSQLKDREFQLSIVPDLPLVFGIWAIANLGNVKHARSLKKIVHKTNEVLEMLTFMEKSQRMKWLKEFVSGVGADKIGYLDLTDESKAKFIEDNLVWVRLLDKKQLDNTASATESSGTAKSSGAAGGIQEPQQQPLAQNDGNYLFSLLQNINKLPTRRPSQEKNLAETALARSEHSIVDGIVMSDITSYIASLQDAGVDSSIISQLLKYLRELGMEPPRRFDESDENDIIIRGGDVDGFGTFASDDQSYVKLLKKFVKSFEVDGLQIEVKRKDSIESSVPDRSSRDDLIKGYEQRIKKLENLLHQQTFRKFSDQWSRRQDSTSTVQTSVNTQQLIEPHKVIDLPPSHTGEKLDKLTRENEKLRSELQQLKEAATSEKIAELQQQAMDAQLEAEMVLKGSSAKQDRIDQLERDIEAIVQDKRKMASDQEILQQKVAELTDTNAKLSATITQKDKECVQKEEALRLEMLHLQERIGQFEEAAKSAIPSDDTTEVIRSLADKAGALSQRSLDDLNAFCLILESVGLLLVKDSSVDNGYVIKRVKGLRSRKKELLRMSTADASTAHQENEDHDSAGTDGGAGDVTSSSHAMLNVVASDYIETADSNLKWLPDASTQQVSQFIGEFKDGSDARYSKFLESSSIDKQMLVDKVYRRFNDVETLARRLQKEKNQQKAEIKLLSGELSERLAIKDFKVGDLVLFLKTLNTEQNSRTGGQPWAVFNVGAPNHYLKNKSSDLSRKDWFVGRIERIEDRVITEESYSNPRENPFKLATGLTWHYVDAKEIT